MKTNQEYKKSALASLEGAWPEAAIASIVLLVAIIIQQIPQMYGKSHPSSMALMMLLGFAISIFLITPLTVAYSNTFRALYEKGERGFVQNMYKLFCSNYLHVVLTNFVMGLLIALGFILLIVPGIILALAYAMVPFILVEHPEYSVKETLKASREMMKGHKFDYFYLMLSFIGWILLSILSLGIGLIWLYPYIMTTAAAFYNDLKAEKGIDQAPLKEEPTVETA